MSLKSILKLNLAELLVDNSKKIFIIKFTNNNYNRDEFITLLEYFNNFWFSKIFLLNKCGTRIEN